MADVGLTIKIILTIYNFMRLLMPRIIKWIYPFKKEMMKFDIKDIHITNIQHYQKLSFTMIFNDYSLKTIDLKLLRFYIECSSQNIVEFEKSIFLKIDKNRYNYQIPVTKNLTPANITAFKSFMCTQDNKYYTSNYDFNIKMDVILEYLKDRIILDNFDNIKKSVSMNCD